MRSKARTMWTPHSAMGLLASALWPRAGSRRLTALAAAVAVEPFADGDLHFPRQMEWETQSIRYALQQQRRLSPVVTETPRAKANTASDSRFILPELGRGPCCRSRGPHTQGDCGYAGHGLFPSLKRIFRIYFHVPFFFPPPPPHQEKTA